MSFQVTVLLQSQVILVTFQQTMSIFFSYFLFSTTMIVMLNSRSEEALERREKVTHQWWTAFEEADWKGVADDGNERYCWWWNVEETRKKRCCWWWKRKVFGDDISLILKDSSTRERQRRGSFFSLRWLCKQKRIPIFTNTQLK